MKAKILLTLALSATVCTTAFSQTDENGYTLVELTTGPQYQNRVFYDFSDNQITSQPADAWDIAFYKLSAFEFGTRINDAQNIEVYEVSDEPGDWDAVNPNNTSTWSGPLYNPDNTTNIANGAFEQGSATYGWGEYNFVSHHVQGTVIFILKYLTTGQMYKFMINDYYSGYTFKYAKWNGSSWDATQTKTLANGTDDAFFNYFSFATGEKVPNLEPAKANWDLMFTRYWTFYGGQQMYRLSGAIQNPNLSVAKVQPETQATSQVTAPAADQYSKNITAIGHSWKPTTGLYNDVVYYVKNGDTYYRMYFTQNGGGTTGNMYFKYKDITSLLDVKSIGAKANFGIYPNPAVDKKVTLIYDVKEKGGNSGKAEIYDMAGKKVYETSLSAQSGFYQKEVNLQQLASGVYLVKISYGGATETKKLIIK